MGVLSEPEAHRGKTGCGRGIAYVGNDEIHTPVDCQVCGHSESLVKLAELSADLFAQAKVSMQADTELVKAVAQRVGLFVLQVDEELFSAQLTQKPVCGGKWYLRSGGHCFSVRASVFCDVFNDRQSSLQDPIPAGLGSRVLELSFAHGVSVAHPLFKRHILRSH